MERIEFCRKLLKIVRTLALIAAVGFLWGTRFTEPLASEREGWCGVLDEKPTNLKRSLNFNDPDKVLAYNKGEQLYKSNCASCHKLNKKLIGPELKGVSNKYEKEWLYQWIRNSQKMIKAGDDRANAIYNEYNQSVMTAFPTLSNEDIDHILVYIDLE